MEPGEIRTLIVHPSLEDSAPNYSLKIRAKEQWKDYEALSYF